MRNSLSSFNHYEVDIRNRDKILELIKLLKPDAIVHAAAQPSHDKAASIPFEDFDVNAVGTLNLLEATRLACPESPFIHLSTNKVYGDGPNKIKLKELETNGTVDVGVTPLFSVLISVLARSAKSRSERLIQVCPSVAVNATSSPAVFRT